jgi:hypothetical protein
MNKNRLSEADQLNGTYRNKRALLIGNGINQLDTSQSFSWGQLLTELKEKFSIDVDLDNVFKPFPLAFDEMLHRKSGVNDFKENIETLKKNIRESVDSQLEDKRGYNKYHQKIMKLDYDDILTTNYDYSLQKSIEPDFLKKKREFARDRREIKYSFKRSYSLPRRETVVWHIHGELMDTRAYRRVSGNYPEKSILIGYQHYSDYLQKIQENISGESGIQKIENQSLRVRLRNEEQSPFWMDIFFTHNLDIVGQSFDFSENHLWWLINHRASLIRDFNGRDSIKVNNIIRFYYPKIDSLNKFDLEDLKNMDKIIRKKNDVDKSKAISELLRAFMVEPVAIRCKSFTDFYDKLTTNFLHHK